MAAFNDCGFELIQHPLYSPEQAPYDPFIPKVEKSIFTQMMTSYMRWRTSRTVKKKPFNTAGKSVGLC